jgi:hypothetical protein
MHFQANLLWDFISDQILLFNNHRGAEGWLGVGRQPDGFLVFKLDPVKKLLSSLGSAPQLTSPA